MFRSFFSVLLVWVAASSFAGQPEFVRLNEEARAEPTAEELEMLRSIQSVVVVFKEAAVSKKDGRGVSSVEKAVFKKIKMKSKLFATASMSKKGRASRSRAARNLDNMYVAEVADGETLRSALAELQRSPLVEYAEPDWPIELLSAPNDPHFNPEQWSLNNTGQSHTAYDGSAEVGVDDADIDWLEAWESPDFPTDTIIIAVVDTGVDYTHRDLTNQMWVNSGEAGLDTNGVDKAINGIDDDLNGYVDDYLGVDLVNTDSDPIDDNLHGTHVAGTIAAEANNGYGIAGICPSAQIMAIKIFDAAGRGYTSDGIPGIRYAADNGAKVINNSWGGGGYSQALQDAITYANEKGASVMCASGNNGAYMAMYPASYAGAVSVGATDSSDARAYFSNYGPWVDVMAPGHNIFSLLSSLVPNPPYGKFEDDFLIISGTSMACPTASGAMGLLMSQHPGHEPWIYEKVMEATCDAGIYSLPSSEGFDGDLGAGRIDVDDLLVYNESNAFVRSTVNLHFGFGRSFLAPGEATNLMIKVGTWMHDIPNLELVVTSLSSDATLNETHYVLGDVPAQTTVHVPSDTFVVGCTTNAQWNSIKQFRVELKSGDTVFETRTNSFRVYNGQVSEFCTYDLDNDGIKEIIGKYGSVLSVFDQHGNLKWFKDFGQYWSVIGSPAVGDVDGDGKAEVAVTVEKRTLFMVTDAELYVIEHDGSMKTNVWPIDLHVEGIAGNWLFSVNPCGLLDVDGDDDLDMVVSGSPDMRASYAAYDEYGTKLGDALASSEGRATTLTALGDLNADGSNEILSIEHGTHDGEERAWVVVRDSLTTPLYEYELMGGTDMDVGSVTYAPVAADIDLDGEKEMVAGIAIDKVGYLTVIKQDGSVLEGFPVQVNNTTAYDVPVVADADGDGDLEIFTFRSDLQQILGFDHHGDPLPNFPLSDTNLPARYANGYRPVIGDVDGDGEPELVYGGNYQVDDDADDSPYTFQIIARDIKDGMMVPGYPITLEGIDGGWSPKYRIMLDSLSEDEFGTNQYLIASIGSELFVIGTGQSFDPGQQHWPHYNHDCRNSYHYDILPAGLSGGFGSTNRLGLNAYTANFKGVRHASSTTAVTYFWNFGDESSVVSGVELDTPSHDYTEPGLYTVSLTLSNAAGEVYSVTRDDFITVYSNLTADFVHSPTGTLTAPIRVDFVSTTENLAQYVTWDFGDIGENSLQAPNAVVDDTGSGWALGSATPGGLNIGQNNGSLRVDVPTPAILPVGLQTVQEGDTLEFQVQLTNGNSSVFLTNVEKPASAAFSSDGETGTFTWESASPGGIYEATFVIEDVGFDGFASDGLDSTQTVTICVIPNPTNAPNAAAPILSAIGSKSVIESNALEFAVYGFDLFDGDEVSLSVSNLPAGAVFNTVTNAGQVTNLFSWAEPSPSGVYTMSFYAADSTNVVSETVTVSVASAWSVPAVTAVVNEVRADGVGLDQDDFVEILAPAGTDLTGCFLAHHDGGSSDGELWRFTFPAFTVPDDGVTNDQGRALGFAVLSQSNAPVAEADFMLPAELNNLESGLILYDAHTNVLDAVAWGAAGDLTVDDPSNTLSQLVDSSDNTYLHVTQADDGSTQFQTENASFIFPTSGTFTVTLIVNNELGERVAIQKTIVIDDYFGPVDTHYVSLEGGNLYPYKTWADAATNLADAVAALEPGHTILVTNGLYTAGQRVRNPVSDTVIRSVNGPEVTLIDGQNLYPGISLEGTNSLIEGFTVQHCVGQPPALNMGAGIGNPVPGTVARNMIIRNNERLLFGGTVYANEASFLDSTVYSNKCYTGAGVFSYNGIVSNCVFRLNESTAGSIVQLSSSSALYGSLVADNVGCSGVELTTGGHVYNTTIANNTITETLGGGLEFDGNLIDNASECFNVISYGNSSGRNVFFNWPSSNPKYDKPQKRAMIYNCCWPTSIISLQDPGQVVNEITDAPLFVNVSEGNYRLQSDSSCRDTGRDDLTYTNKLQEVRVDLGSSSYLSSNPWNNITTTNAGMKIANMINSEGASSGLSLEFPTAFNGSATDGTSFDTDFDYPSSAERDNLYWEDLEIRRDFLRIGGISTNRPYDFGFYASRTGDTYANSKYHVGVFDTDVLAAGGSDAHYRYEELTGLRFDSTNALIEATHSGGTRAALSLFHLTEWDPASEVNGFAGQLDLAGNPRLTGSHVDIGAYEIAISNIPNVTVSATPTAGPAALEVAFSTTSWDDGSITNYHWAFGDGITLSGSSQSAPTHTYGAGSFVATVTVTDNDGMTQSDSIGIFADPAWPAAPTAFVATNISPSQNDLSWTDNATNETSFVLQHRVVTNYAEIIIDDADPEVAFVISSFAPWETTANANAYGGSYEVCKSSAEGNAKAYYTPELEEGGLYEIYEWHPADSRHATAVRTEIYHQFGMTYTYVNQEINGSQWNRIGTYYLEEGSYVKIFPYSNDEWFGADAFKFVRIEPWQTMITLAADSEETTDISLIDDRTYGYRIAASNQYGLSPWVEAQTTIPSTNLLPTASIDSLSPASGIPDLAVTAIGSGFDPDGTVTHYIWNFGDGYSGSIQSGPTLTNASYIYRNIGIYDVTLTVFDNLGYSSTVTNSVNVYGAIPNAPSQLTAVPDGERQINLAWVDEAYNEENVIIQRKTGAENFAFLALVDDIVTNYADTAIIPGVPYTYRVAATNEHGISDGSNEATTNTVDLTPPTIQSATAVNPTNVLVIYNEPVEHTSAQTAVNYTLNLGGAILSAIHETNTPDRVLLSVSPLSEGLEYTLVINDVRDFYGDNPIASDTLGNVTYWVYNIVRFDFGSAYATTGKWNNVTEKTTGVKVSDAVNSDGTSTGIGLEILTAFNGMNSSGVSDNSVYPTTAQRDSIYTANSDQFQLTGLDTGTFYNLTFFASRSGTANDYVSTYSAVGTSVELDASNNTSNTVTLSGIVADGSSNIVITVDEGTVAGNGYLGVLEVQFPRTPESAALEASTQSINVHEGSINTFGLRLTAEPETATTVTVAHVSGDADLSVQSGSETITFTTNNWMTHQYPVVAAAQDDDFINGTATIRCFASGMADLDITATEDDDETDPTYAIPWEETFEERTLGDLDGQHGWIAEAGATVQTGTTQILSLQNATASHTFDGAQNDVLIEFDAKFIRGAATPTDTGTAVAIFSIDAEGHLVAYSNETPITLSGTTLTDEWHTFKAQLDYTAQTWDMWVDDVLLIDDFAFYSTQSDFLKIAFQSGSQAAFIDEIRITNNQPDTDGDGIPDTWEGRYYGGETNAIATNLCANGINTILQAYIAGLNPTNATSFFEVSNVRNILHWNATNARIYSIYWSSNLLSGFDEPLENNLPWTAMPYTDTNHTSDGKGFYKIEVELEE